MSPSDMLEQLKRAWERRGGHDDRTGPLTPIKPNWRDYFRRFCERHGKQPLIHRGVLLFPDGWTCSASDHAGPYWEPPEDEIERVRLQRAYWKQRAKAVKKELPAAKLRVDQLKELASTKDRGDVEVRVDTALFDKTKGEWIRNKEPVPVSQALVDAEQRLGWLEEDLRLCELMIVDPNQVEEEVQV